MNTPQAIVFDFDGVLVDSEHLHDEALCAVCGPLGFAWEGAPWVGFADADVLIELYRRRGEALSAPALADLLHRKTEVVLEQVRAGLYKPYPGAIELVHAAAKITKVAVCSAGMRAQIEPVLEHFGIAGVISALVAYEDTTKSKPDPEPYLLAAKKLGVEPRGCIAIEDSPRGVESAKAAGYRVVAVGHTTTREALNEAHLFVQKIEMLHQGKARLLISESHR